MLRGLFQSKKVDALLGALHSHEGGDLKRVLGAFDLTLLGVGAIVGAGIFATIGTAAAGNTARPGAGPSLLLSFVITAVVCGFTALCYAELAATVPISGSAYTYAYATLGELAAWIIGWDLILEYAISNVAIAISWSNYFRVLLHNIGIDVPLWLATDMRTAATIPGFLQTVPHVWGVPIVFNALALLITALLTWVVIWGIQESSRFNAVMVLLKVAVLAFFVAIAFTFVPTTTMQENMQPFFPNGWTGTFTGAAIVFFAFVGFDSVSTVTEETRNPGRNVPLGILASLVVCTVLYLVVTAVFTGLVPYPELIKMVSNEQAEPLTMALQHVAPDNKWASTIVAIGAVMAQTTALLVYQIAQPRIFFAMARDGLLPPVFAKVHPKYKTPHMTVLFTSVFIGGVAAAASIDEMVDLTNIGTLFAFVMVCVGVPLMRWQDPHRPRPFKVPLGPYLFPALGAASCLFLMWFLPPASWWRFLGWLTLGLAVYLVYGYTRSRLGREMGRPERTPASLKLAGAALGVTAVGLFALPHDAGVTAIVRAISGDGVVMHSRAVVGVTCIGVGMAVMLATVAQRLLRRLC